MYKKMQEDLMARHAAEKEGECFPGGVVCVVSHTHSGSLEAQRVKYEEQLCKLREQLEQSNASPTPPTHRYTT